MIRSLFFSSKGSLQTGLDEAEFRSALRDRRGVLWVDFEATPPESDEPVLREVFGFHPLARTDRAAPYPARS